MFGVALVGVLSVAGASASGNLAGFEILSASEAGSEAEVRVKVAGSADSAAGAGAGGDSVFVFRMERCEFGKRKGSWCTKQLLPEGSKWLEP